MDDFNLTEELQRSVTIAQSIARECFHEKFSSAHLLRAILNHESIITSVLERLGKDVGYIRDWADFRIEQLPRNSSNVESPIGDDTIKKVFAEANTISIKLGKEKIDTVCTFAAIIKTNIAFNSKQLSTLPISESELLESVTEISSISNAVQGIDNTEKIKEARGPLKTLSKYCVDKTSLAKEEKIDPIIGRDDEVRMVSEILGRRSKPNVLIVGEPGVGKTALVDGFALEIVNEKVPTNLKEAVLYELDLGALVAGASYKGEVEDRVKNILKEIKSFEKAILFIDEIHLLLDKSGPLGTGMSNLLKPELARGAITVIGATTNDEYRKFIEKEEAFNRRFELLRVEEPDHDTTIKMLKGILPIYSEHHTLEVEADALEEAVVLAKRYLRDRRLPDAAIDLVDRTMAAIKMMTDTSFVRIQALQERLENDFTEIDNELEELRWLLREMRGQLSPILLANIEDTQNPAEIENVDQLKNYLNNTLNFLKEKIGNKGSTVEPADISAMIAQKTGIPLGKIQSSEQEKLLCIESHLEKRVIGQNSAIKALAESIRQSRAGLQKPGLPVGSFFFLGPTGTGKTELAKALAELLFDDESAMIRFDMSEFKEEHSAATLIGAPPGYIGYEEGGILVNKIRERPYSVLLFDEVEKAHLSVYDLFLKILDEGKLHDRLGKEGDFSNAVILFTSNIGSEFIIEQFEKGELPSSERLREIMAQYFRPEFLARVTEIVPFAPIQGENVVKIFDIHLKRFEKLLDKQGISLEIDSETKDYLANTGFNPKYGGRPLAGVIRNRLIKKVSSMIISGELKEGKTLEIAHENDELIWNVN